jgi:starch-binding outer membrane protein SusE/F
MKTKLLLLFAIFLTAFNVNAQNPGVVSITGEAVGGWGDGHDFDMTSTDGVNWTYSGLICATAATDGGIKFRADHAWTVNWGSASFPSGTGTQNGANILCIAGTYDVTFNSTTGEYNFSGGSPIPTVKIIGSAVTGGEATMSTLDLETFTVSNITLLDGMAQFSVDTAIFGGNTFPSGSIVDDTLMIPVVAGTYSTVSVNLTTGEYRFIAAPVFPVISITGIGVGGWGDGFDFDMTTTDGVTYTYNALAINGTPDFNQIKFRTNHDWSQPNYGGSGWPTGVATTTGGNITATASGTYDVTFNLTTGEYTFSFPLISLTGQAFGGWGDGFDFDLTTTDGANYSINSITAVETNGAKFRTNHAWNTPNYGSTSFPVGAALATTSDNIPVIAGTYGVTFNRVSGDFEFGAPLATTTFASNNFRVYPNPTANNWNFVSANNAITSVQIVDVLGKVVLTVNGASNEAKVNASSLNAGIYFAKIATANATETIKLVKN